MWFSGGMRAVEGPLNILDRVMRHFYWPLLCHAPLSVKKGTVVGNSLSEIFF